MTKKKKKTNKVIMALGGTVQDPMGQYLQNQYNIMSNRPNVIQDPNQALMENNIAMANATAKANNGLTQIMDVAGGMILDKGLNILSGGLSTALNSAIKPKMAFGGRVPGQHVEVEGQEVGQLPGGQMVDFQGPSHEAGGIDVNLPAGTDVYSKRVKGADGKSMAKRKKQREANLAKIQKKYDANKSDKYLKSTLDRAVEANKQADLFDQMLQSQAAALQSKKGGAPKLWSGTRPGGLDPERDENGIPLEGALITATAKPSSSVESLYSMLPTSTPFNSAPLDSSNWTVPGSTVQAPKDTFNWKGALTDTIKGMPTGGDMLGMIGNYKQAFDPYKTTLAERASDTPNKNAFENFGQDALNTIDGMKTFAVQNKEAQMKALNDQAVASRAMTRNGARSVNTLRALDIASNAQRINAMTDIHTNFANQMMNILNQETGLEKEIDLRTMTGEQTADLADRQDKGAFYSQLAQDQRAVGEGISKIAGNINANKERNVNTSFLNTMSDFIEVDPKTGKFKMKEGVNLNGNLPALPIDTTAKPTESKIADSTWNNLVNPETGEVFKNVKEYQGYTKKMAGNKYLDAPTEFDTSYSKYVDPTTNKPFTNKSDYEMFTAAGHKGVEYIGGDLFSGDKQISSKLSAEDKAKVTTSLGKYLMSKNKSNFNLNDIASVKALEKELGLKETGIIGPKVLKALLAATGGK